MENHDHSPNKRQGQDKKLNTNIDAKDILSESENLNQNIKSKKKEVTYIFADILKSINQVDFREYCKILNDKDKLFKKHYSVACIEILLETVNKKGYNLCRKNELIYLYNTQYWENISDEVFKDFLGDAALKMGVDKFDAKHYLFKEDLYKQFLADAALKEIKPDAKTTLINLSNGTFEITPEKQILRPFNSLDFLTYQLSFAYDEKAEAPKFKAFLDEMLPEVELQNILAEYLGYIFVKNSVLKMEKVLLLYGTGGNGKSVIFDTITALLGHQNICNYSLYSLTTENSKSRINLLGNLLNYSSEINGKLESNIFKQMVSGEPIEIPVLYKQSIIATDYARLMFNCNELPKEVENTNAFFRRFIIIPFRKNISDDKKNVNLAKQIINNELSGVFNWILKGLIRLLDKQKFTESDIVNNEVLQYKKESDSVLLFLEDENYSKSINSFLTLKTIYIDYKQYCMDNGYRQVSSKNLSKRLEKAGYTKEHRREGTSFDIEKNFSY